MSYFINKRGTKWGLIFRSMNAGKKTSTRIKVTDLLQYGLRPDMTVEEAKARAKQLNAETKYQRTHERSKLRALSQADLERGLESKHFPALLVEEFEEKRLRGKFEFGGDDSGSKYKKAVSRWRFARQMVKDVDLKPEDWADEPRVFYRYFIKKQISLDYASKVIGVLNLWGHFIGKKQGRPIFPIPAPRGYDREAIADAYNESEKRKKESLPLSHELLESKREALKPEQYRWMYVSLWFGLRPKEVEGQWKVVEEGGMRVLAIYQSKLTTLSKDKRWKYIPAKYPEQRKALEMLKGADLKRPIMSTLRTVFGDGYTTYAGRKGFTNLMLDRGEPFEDVSDWMGHQNVDQTWRRYRDRKRVRFGKAS